MLLTLGKKNANGFSEIFLVFTIDSESQFQVKWISQASASQRAGRAGRTSHGFCYRLYSPAVFANSMEPFSLPELCRIPLQRITLQMINIGIPSVESFPFPTPPNADLLKKTLEELEILGTIQKVETIENYTVTELGKVICLFPLEPRISKLLLIARFKGKIHLGILMASLLSVESIFEENTSLKQFRQNENSDIILSMNIAIVLSKNRTKENFQKYRIREKIFVEFENILDQLTSLCLKLEILDSKPTFSEITFEEMKTLEEVLIASFIDNVARKIIDPNSKKVSYETFSGMAVVSSNSCVKNPDYCIYREMIKTDEKFSFNIEQFSTELQL